MHFFFPYHVSNPQNNLEGTYSTCSANSFNQSFGPQKHSPHRERDINEGRKLELELEREREREREAHFQDSVLPMCSYSHFPHNFILFYFFYFTFNFLTLLLFLTLFYEIKFYKNVVYIFGLRHLIRTCHIIIFLKHKFI